MGIEIVTPGPSSSRVLVPQGGDRTKTEAIASIYLEDIKLVDNPLMNPEMVALMMETHYHFGNYMQVCLPPLLYSIDLYSCSYMITDFVLQDIIQRSHRKSQRLKGYADTVLHEEALERELAKERLESSCLYMNFYGVSAKYRNHIQQLEEQKGSLVDQNKSLRQRVKGNFIPLSLSEY